MQDTTYTLARNTAALMDLSAEGRLRISGAECEAALDSLFSVDLEMLAPYKGTIGLFLAADGHTIAIAVVFKGEDEFFVFTEAETKQALSAYLNEQLQGRDVEIENLDETTGWIAVVGPKAQDVTAKAAGEDILGMPYHSFEDNTTIGGKLFRMGQVGEFEYRFLVPAAETERVRAALLEAGAGFGIGEGDASAIPMLMLEMRSLLHSDIPASADPIQAGLHWMVDFRKPGLPAGEKLAARKAQPERRALMVVAEDDGKMMAGDLLAIAGEEVGIVVRSAWSQTLGRSIALSYVRDDLGWVGVPFDVLGAAGKVPVKGVSAPLFVTRTVQAS